MFFTNWAAADVANPIASLSSQRRKAENGGWFGWPEDAKMEEMRDAYARSGSPDAQKKIAADIQARVYDEVIYIPLGQYMAPAAWRKIADRRARRPSDTGVLGISTRRS